MILRVGVIDRSRLSKGDHGTAIVGLIGALRHSTACQAMWSCPTGFLYLVQPATGGSALTIENRSEFAIGSVGGGIFANHANPWEAPQASQRSIGPSRNLAGRPLGHDSEPGFRGRQGIFAKLPRISRIRSGISEKSDRSPPHRIHLLGSRAGLFLQPGRAEREAGPLDSLRIRSRIGPCRTWTAPQGRATTLSSLPPG